MRSTDENRDHRGNKEPLVTLVLPDDDKLEAIFQELWSKLRAVCQLTDKDAVVAFPSWEKFRRNKSQLGGDPARVNPKRWQSLRRIWIDDL